ncbi:unnamed protein product [Rotaria socialis]|uniref:Uncharacterized protein n=1 Tax=Rotaria socialis TaxID=392032 RepID=A0A820P4Z7_9BILA|nr:unnamed protein product [Rotaria socialis]CAF3172837.1 unnamed protein product [Rotaria socialis]CAF3683534.1 unnamed protein product [Rotaria socialis]CAF3796007.1 unnamed protein product [Rotaria socialis]CAF4235853.1 unnamed protein product [Rotaria socialis]
MNSNVNYSPFIEHSFRRLSLLIHQQDILNATTPSTTASTTGEKSSNALLLVKNKENKFDNSCSLSFLSEERSHQQSTDRNTTNSNEIKTKFAPITKTNRTFMRPPKTQTTSYRCSSLHLSDQSETSLSRSSNAPCSPSITQQKLNELHVHIPVERSLYDIKFERDRHNDLREKYNIPPPFQRKWLREPRYTPKERPNCGQVQQSEN